MATIRKRQTAIWKVRHEQGDWHMDQASIMKVITNKFSERFKSDNLIN